MEYELILGLEIHLQLNTNKKMFCYCKNDPFNSEPNTNICPVCTGLPGALPIPNKDAIIQAQKIAHALGSKLNDHIIFERKNYFYPDLPKGYQITCPHDPISTGGEIDLSYWGFGKIRFSEIHLEEDTGKSIHKTNETWLDYNKSSVPLLEIVTMPDFRSVDEAVEYCKEVQRIARAVKVSEADMEKGHMRLEANISLRKKGETGLPNYKVEIKNINSFSFMRKAVLYEIKRQTEALEKNEKLVQETRGFNETKNITFSQRDKENAHDYRYFPDPDIPFIKFDKDWLDSITNAKVVLPCQKRVDYLSKNIKKNNIDILIDNPDLEIKLNQIVDLLPKDFADKYNKAANWVINKPEYKILNAIDIVAKESMSKPTIDNSQLSVIITTVLQNNQSTVAQYKSGKENVIQFLIGQVMKESKGYVDASLVNKLLKEKLI